MVHRSHGDAECVGDSRKRAGECDNGRFDERISTQA